MKTMKTRVFGAFLALLTVVSCVFAGVISASAANTTFKDVKKGDWHYEFVTYMAEKEIINGYNKGTYYEFRPNDYVKRSEFIKMLVTTFGLKKSGSAGTSFSDVKSGDWYYEYYSIAASKGIISEVFSGTEMKPNQTLTREEAAALLMAYLDYPDDDVVSTSKFDDYNTITSKYRTFVLQAAYADIINGFNDGGQTNFRPKEGLRRAQAAKILSTAAGTVADGTVKDFAFDYSDNITVVDAATITGLDGIENVIIGEDVKGTVTFTGCSIDGTVYNRSGAKVVFSNCDIDSLELNGASSSVELKQKTSVGEIDVNVPQASIKFMSSASADKVVVESGATGLDITTEGSDCTISDMSIHANNVKSAITPRNLIIDNDKSATIGTLKYQNGIKGELNTTWSGEIEKLLFETYAGGKIYYFYTKTNSGYTASNFATNYNNAAVKDVISVAANKKYSEVTKSSVIDDSSKYIVIAFQNGSTYTTPVVYDRGAYKTGFKTLPTLTGTASSNVVSVSVNLTYAGGTTYLYLTNDEAVPESYSIAKAIWDSVDATARSSTSTGMFGSLAKTVVENYKYCVFFRIDSDKNELKPVVVKTPLDTTDFSEKPSLVVGGGENGDDVIKFTPNFDGKIKFYYTDKSMSFNNNAQLFEYFAPAASGDTHTVSFKKNQKVEIPVDELNESNKFVAIRITKNPTYTGGKDTDIVITMLERKIDGTGFKSGTTPAAYRVKGSTKNIAVTFEVANANRTNNVKYLFLDYNKTYTSSAEFLKDYNKGTYISRTVDYNGTGLTGAQLCIEETNKSYVAFLVEDNNGRYFAPKTVRVDNTGYGISNPKFTFLDTGFEDKNGDPTDVKCKLTFEAILPLKLKYKAFSKLPSSYELSTEEGTPLNGGKPVKVGKNEITVDASVVSGNNKYIYVCVYFDDSQIGYLSLGDVKASYTETRYGVKLTPDVALIKDEFVDMFRYDDEDTVNGELRWYYTNTVPTTVSAFNSGYASASFRNGATESITSTSGAIEAYPISFVSEYRYFVYLFSDGTSTTYTVSYCDMQNVHKLVKSIKLSEDNKTIEYVPYVDSEGGSMVVKYYYSDTKDTFGKSTFITTVEKKNANGYISYENYDWSTFKYKYDQKAKIYSGKANIDERDYFGELAMGDTLSVTQTNRTRYLYIAIFRNDESNPDYKTYKQYGYFEFTIPAKS